LKSTYKLQKSILLNRFCQLSLHAYESKDFATTNQAKGFHYIKDLTKFHRDFFIMNTLLQMILIKPLYLTTTPCISIQFSPLAVLVFQTSKLSLYISISHAHFKLSTHVYKPVGIDDIRPMVLKGCAISLYIICTISSFGNIIYLQNGAFIVLSLSLSLVMKHYSYWLSANITIMQLI